MRAEEERTCLDRCRITGPEGFSVSLTPSPSLASLPPLQLFSAGGSGMLGGWKPVPRNGSQNTGPVTQPQTHRQTDRKMGGKRKWRGCQTWAGFGSKQPLMESGAGWTGEEEEEGRRGGVSVSSV